jgi:hypothetical protein
MIERHGGLWVAPAGELVYERYDPRLDRIALVCKRADGRFEACLYVKGGRSELYCLPSWEPKNEKAILPTEQAAMAHLAKLTGELHEK